MAYGPELGYYTVVNEYRIYGELCVAGRYLPATRDRDSVDICVQVAIDIVLPDFDRRYDICTHFRSNRLAYPDFLLGVAGLGLRHR